MREDECMTARDGARACFRDDVVSTRARWRRGGDARAQGRRGTEVPSPARDPSAEDATTIAPTRGGGVRRAS